MSRQDEPKRLRNFWFRIYTSNGNTVETRCQGFDEFNAQYNLRKYHYKNAQIIEQREI